MMQFRFLGFCTLLRQPVPPPDWKTALSHRLALSKQEWQERLADASLRDKMGIVKYSEHKNQELQSQRVREYYERRRQYAHRRQQLSTGAQPQRQRPAPSPVITNQDARIQHDFSFTDWRQHRRISSSTPDLSVSAVNDQSHMSFGPGLGFARNTPVINSVLIEAQAGLHPGIQLFATEDSDEKMDTSSPWLPARNAKQPSSDTVSQDNRGTHIATVLHCRLLLQHTKTTAVLISNLLPMNILSCTVAMGTMNNGINMTVQMAIQLATSLVRALTPSHTAKTLTLGRVTITSPKMTTKMQTTKMHTLAPPTQTTARKKPISPDNRAITRLFSWGSTDSSTQQRTSVFCLFLCCLFLFSIVASSYEARGSAGTQCALLSSQMAGPYETRGSAGSRSTHKPSQAFVCAKPAVCHLVTHWPVSSFLNLPLHRPIS